MNLIEMRVREKRESSETVVEVLEREERGHELVLRIKLKDRSARSPGLVCKTSCAMTNLNGDYSSQLKEVAQIFIFQGSKQKRQLCHGSQREWKEQHSQRARARTLRGEQAHEEVLARAGLCAEGEESGCGPGRTLLCNISVL